MLGVLAEWLRWSRWEVLWYEEATGAAEIG